MRRVTKESCERDFGEFIRHERERRKLSQTEVAQMLGVDQSYYCRIEKGQRSVDLVTAIHICTELDVDISDFIKKYM